MLRIIVHLRDVAQDALFDTGARFLHFPDLALEKIAVGLGAAAQSLIQRVLHLVFMQPIQCSDQSLVEGANIGIADRYRDLVALHETLIVVDGRCSRIP